MYAYRCTQCGHRFEKIQNFSADPELVCPQCHGVLERPLTAPRLHFKGAGWYVNDYASKSKEPAAGAGAESGKVAAAADAKRQQFEIKSVIKAQAEEAGIQVVEPAGSKTFKAVTGAAGALGEATACLVRRGHFCGFRYSRRSSKAVGTPPIDVRWVQCSSSPKAVFLHTDSDQ